MASKISNFFTKILLGLLLVLMIAGVAVWGINDILIGSNNKTVARVGNSKITEFELQNIVQSSKMKLMQQGLTNISDEFNSIIRNNALVNLIGDRLLQNEFANLNLQIDGKELLKKDYLSQPDFNKENLTAYVRSQGGEDAFLSRIIKEKKIDILQGSITAITPVTDGMVKSAYGFENQSKKVQYVELTTTTVKSANSASEEEIKTFYESNKDSFITPEYRSASYIVLGTSSVKISKNEDAVDKLHEVSGEILDKVAGGATLEEIAKEYGLNISTIESIDSDGNSKDGEKATLPKVDNFVQALFATEQGEISDLLESGDGKKYALVRTDGVTEKRIKDLSEVKDLVVEALKTKGKAEKLVDIAKTLKMDLDAGKTTLDKFAAENGISLKEIEITSKSKAFSPDFVTGMMNLKKGGYSDIGRNAKGALIIGTVVDINKSAEPSELNLFEYRSKLQDQVSQEIMAQYLDYLKQKYNVSVY